jgi:ketosteroid isomerase-like protein
MTNDNRAIIQRLYGAADAGDTATIESLIDDNCTLMQADGHPVPGTWHGRDSMMQAMARVFAVLHNSGVTVHEIVADGPTRVVGLVDARGTDTNGEPYAMPIAECFRVENGKVTEIRPFYWDLVRLRRLAGVGEAGSPASN